MDDKETWLEPERQKKTGPSKERWQDSTGSAVPSMGGRDAKTTQAHKNHSAEAWNNCEVQVWIQVGL